MEPFRNPILPGFNPDPTIIRVEDDYFLCTSSFEYFPAVPVYHSRDLISWKLIGHVLTRKSQLNLRVCESSCGVFAPTLRFYDGRYYMTVCAMQRKGGEGPGFQMTPPRGFYVWSDNIWDSKSWSDPIYYDVLGIDQDLYHDAETGRAYLSWANYCDDSSFDRPRGMSPIATFICEIDLATGRQKSPAKLLRYSKAGSGCCEGPHIFRKDDYVYLITAEGGTEIGHQQWVYRTKSDPYAAKWEVAPKGAINPMIYNAMHPQVRQTGHMDLVEGKDGRWWAVFLGVRPVYEGEEALPSPLGRETFLAPVEWTDGWPIVNHRQPITLDGLPVADLPRTPRDFQIPLAMKPDRDLYLDGWYHLRTPLKIDHDLSSHPGSLTMWGGPYSIEIDECPTMLLQKQPDFFSTFSFMLDFQPKTPMACAGLAVWWSRYAYASVFVRVTGSKKFGPTASREIVFRSPHLTGDAFVEKVHPYPGEGSVRIRLNTEPNLYQVFVGAGKDRAAEILVGMFDSRSLARTRKFDSQNTGTHFGLFAHGAFDQSCMGPAVFSDLNLFGRRA